MTDRPDPSERGPASKWAALERLAAEEDARDLEAMTADERDAELRAHGVDPARAALVGQELLEKAARDAGIELPGTMARTRDEDGHRVPRVPQASRKRRWVSGALLLAALVVILFVALRPPDNRVALPNDDDARTERARVDGLTACRMKAWATCLLRLDEATKLDHALERDPEVRAARDDAKRELADVPQARHTSE